VHAPAVSPPPRLRAGALGRRCRRCRSRRARYVPAPWLRGSITYRHYRAPGERSNWRKEAIHAALVVTHQRLGVFLLSRPIVNVAFDDPRFASLDLRVEEARLAIDADASTFNPQASGQITVRPRSADPAAALATIRSRHA
jgi:hypothetical protein